MNSQPCMAALSSAYDTFPLVTKQRNHNLLATLALILSGFAAGTLWTTAWRGPTLPVVSFAAIPALQRPAARPYLVTRAAQRDGEMLPTTPRRIAIGGLMTFGAMVLPPAEARPMPINRPDLLPSGPVVNIVDVTNTLSPQQNQELEKEIKIIESTFGVKLHVLCQRYPETPGEAVNDYWGVDANTLIVIADPTYPKFLKFDVGENVNVLAPNAGFWTRLRSDFASPKFVKENGPDTAIMLAVDAIAEGLTTVEERGTSMLSN